MQNPIPRSGKTRPPRPREEACPILEDDDDFGVDALDTPEGADMLGHDCGLDHLGKWSLPETED